MLSKYNLDSFASTIYFGDSTGENFIENMIHRTNLPSLINRIPHKSQILELGYREGIKTSQLIKIGYSIEIVEGTSKLCQATRNQFKQKVPIHEFMFKDF